MTRADRTGRSGCASRSVRCSTTRRSPRPARVPTPSSPSARRRERRMAETELDLGALEALIFSADGPLGVSALRRAFPRASQSQIAAAVAEINSSLAATGRPYEIAEVAAGYQFRTRPQFAEVILAATPE